ncbi:MAG: APC family permease, partial [Microcystaceae cyanobacterium]
TLASVVAASGFVNYALVLLALVGVQISPLGLYVLVIGVAWAVAYRDIKLSAMLMLLIEVISIGLILLLAIVILLQHPAIDLPQLSLQNTRFSGMGLGMVLAILSFVGFESAATLGDEAKRPLRSIPQAIIGSAIATGLFFIGMAYIVVLGFRSVGTPLNQSDAPLSVLADQSGISIVGTLIAIGVTIAGFAGTLASINAATRILFLLAQQRLLPRFLGRTHAQNDTPHYAVSVISAITLLISVSLLGTGVRPLDILGYTGALLSYGFLVIYLLFTIAAPVYLRRLGQLRVRQILTSSLAGITLLIPLASSVYPVPSAPYHLFPYLFVVWLVAGVWVLRLWNKN